MRHVADRFTAILDANVLYPFLVRDVLLSFAAAGLFRPLWSEKIMHEWSSRLIETKPERREKIESTVRVMNEHFPEAIVTGYDALIASLNLPDPDDRHVLAAAIRGQAHIIVTENLKDFPEAELEKYDIECCTADEFIANTFQLYVTDALAALKAMRARYVRQPLTPDELKLRLTAAGLVLTASEITPHLSVI
jgi:predicted nucleic acid-binding protein